MKLNEKTNANTNFCRSSTCILINFTNQNPGIIYFTLLEKADLDNDIDR